MVFCVAVLTYKFLPKLREWFFAYVAFEDDSSPRTGKVSPVNDSSKSWGKDEVTPVRINVRSRTALFLEDAFEGFDVPKSPGVAEGINFLDLVGNKVCSILDFTRVADESGATSKSPQASGKNELFAAKQEDQDHDGEYLRTLRLAMGFTNPGTQNETCGTDMCMESTLDMIESGMIPAGPCSPVRAKSGSVPASTLSSLSHWHGLLRRSQSTPHTKTESTPSSKGRSGSDEEMAVSDVTDLPLQSDGLSSPDRTKSAKSFDIYPTKSLSTLN